MTKWTDKSDRNSRFLDGGESNAASISEALKDVFACLQSNIFNKGTALNFDLILFEVNCDTGRLIAAATTSEQHAVGVADGCSLRVQEIQDFWYDLLEKGPSDAEFTEDIAQYVRKLGLAFRDQLVSHPEELRQSSSANGFAYRVFGSEHGVSVFEDFIEMN